MIEDLEPSGSNLTAVLDELIEAEDVYMHHVQQAKYHIQQMRRMEAVIENMLGYLPAVAEAEAVAAKAWGG